MIQLSLLIMSFSMIMSIFLIIPFFILLERKMLGYMQFRKGPKKKSVLGMFQSFSDAIKLILKSHSVIFSVNFYIFQILPILSFLMLMWSWFLMPFKKFLIWQKFSILGFLCLSAMKVYTMLGSGWSSKNKYSFLGGVRGAAQNISYEMSMMFLFFFFLVFWWNLKFNNLSKYKIFYFMKFFMFWMLTIIAECKRSPFDFAEGESELVSGFNVEYSGLEFALLMLSEYGNMILLSVLSSFLFFSNKFKILGFILAFIYILFRGSLPRFRYDLMMFYAWVFVFSSCCFGILILFFLVFKLCMLNFDFKGEVKTFL